MEMSRLARDGSAEPVSRDQILRHARGQGNVYFPCSADHEQDWQPYPVDPYLLYVMTIHTYIHTYIRTLGPALLVLMARCKTRKTFTSRGHTQGSTITGRCRRFEGRVRSQSLELTRGEENHPCSSYSYRTNAASIMDNRVRPVAL